MADVTPGPWRWLGNWLVPVSPAADTILTYTANDDGLHGTEADKALIAAAPDMLAALEHILAGALSLPRFAEDEARAAIAKATGK